MVNFLLDTNVISELRKPGSRMSPPFASWAESHELEAASVSAVTVFELLTGVERLADRDPAQSAVLRRWVEEDVVAAFGSRVLEIDTVISRRAAQLNAPRPRPMADCFIAATALVHGLAVVTRNVSDFVPMGVRVVDPWAQ